MNASIRHKTLKWYLEKNKIMLKKKKIRLLNLAYNSNITKGMEQDKVNKIIKDTSETIGLCKIF